VKTNLVLVPGLLCTKALWAAQIAALGDTIEIMIADHTRHDSMTGIAAAILAAAPERFALAGISMGGYIAFEVVRQAPARVIKLALLDTGARADAPERAEGRRQLIALAEREGVRSAQAQLMPALIHPARLGERPLVDTILQMADDIGVEAFKRQASAIMGRRDSRPLLPTVKCPTLVMVGREDALTPVELSREIATGIHGAGLEIIPEFVHLSTMECPDVVNRALRAWLLANPDAADRAVTVKR
jgi:pimeloyl-ACP methyl ester carboxylesterase